MRSRHSCDMARAEASGTDGRERASDMGVVNVGEVGESSATVKRRDSAEAAEATEAIKTNRSETAAVSAPPGKETVTGTDGQPAEAAPSAKSDTETYAKSSAKSEERDISRSPEGTIKSPAPYWPGPPSPSAAVGHPATVVIRSPSPGFSAYPSPTVVRFPNPVAISIRSPVGRLIRNPDLTVVVRVFPASVCIQIFGAGVIAISVIPRLRAVNHVVAITIPTVPIVAIRSWRNFVLSFLGTSTHRRHFAFFYFSDAFWRGDLGFAFADDHNCVAIGAHFYAKNNVLMSGMNGDIRRVDLRLSFALIKDAVIDETLGELNLDVIVSEIRNIDLCV